MAGQRRSMVYIDNLVDGIVRAELTATDAGLGWWIADARAVHRHRDRRNGRARPAPTRASRDVKRNRFRLPEFAGDIAETSRRRPAGFRPLQQQLHVLGEMNKTIAVDIERRPP